MIFKEIRFFEKSLYLSKEKWCTVNFTLTPRHFNSLQTKVSHINCFNTNRNSKSLPHAFENFCARKIFVSCLLSCDNSVFKKNSSMNKHFTFTFMSVSFHKEEGNVDSAVGPNLAINCFFHKLCKAIIFLHQFYKTTITWKM